MKAQAIKQLPSHCWYLKILSNCTRLEVRAILGDFQISLVV